ncbi:hypothetical protein MKQ70_08510 [Chitinophaga sedimenti]|nr:hypothetical protein [Chitinophaga sedimenti]MCK7555048.1 hypothetical protein [Chitinophaga sedimenti]
MNYRQIFFQSLIIFCRNRELDIDRAALLAGIPAEKFRDTFELTDLR